MCVHACVLQGGFGGDQLDLDAGFLLVGRKSFRITDHDEIHVLERTAPEIDEAPPITGRRHHNADDDDDDDEAWLSLSPFFSLFCGSKCFPRQVLAMRRSRRAF